jgi:hypothetical protein
VRDQDVVLHFQAQKFENAKDREAIRTVFGAIHAQEHVSGSRDLAEREALELWQCSPKPAGKGQSPQSGLDQWRPQRVTPRYDVRGEAGGVGRDPASGLDPAAAPIS